MTHLNFYFPLKMAAAANLKSEKYVHGKYSLFTDGPYFATFTVPDSVREIKVT